MLLLNGKRCLNKEDSLEVLHRVGGTVDKQVKHWMEGLKSGDLSAAFLAHHCFESIDIQEKNLNALVYQDRSATISIAEAADARLRRRENTPMLGIPFIIKDNFNWSGHPSRHGSHITDSYIAPYNATVLKRLLEAGAVPIAKARMDEFAMGSSGEYCIDGPTKNPWDLSRSPGGSSSGATVSVAAGYVPFALGTDTGGSVRLPASFCNLTALRPTYGVLSRYGVTSMASSLDQVGPIARSAKDLAIGFSMMVGRDELDSTSVDLPHSENLQDLKPSKLRGLKIGVPSEYFESGLEPGVGDRLKEALIQFERQGSVLVEISLPHTRYAIDSYYILNTAEVSSNLARFDGVRYGSRRPGNDFSEMISHTRSEGFGMEAKRRILLGAFCLSRGHFEEFYQKAQKVRTLISKDFQQAFDKVDIIAIPTSPFTAFSLGEKLLDPLAMALCDIFTVTTSLASLPTLALPVGLSKGLPVGMQILGPALTDVKILEIAAAFQEVTVHHLSFPPSIIP